jgi:predicted MFS family arabinose efflux permease
MAVWTSASTVAIFVGFAIGGVVNEALGWRNTFIAAGLPGLLLALILVTTVREPVRGAADSVAAPKAEAGLIETVVQLWQIRPFRQMVFSVSLCNFCVFAVLNWAPSHAMRSFGLNSGQVGGVMGTGIALAGGTTMILSGILADRLAKGGLHRAIYAVAGMMAVSAAAFTAAFRAADFTSFSSFFLLGYAALMANPPVSWVILQKYSPPEMRAMATAVLLLVISLTAMVPAPWIIGRVSDLLTPAYGAASLGLALLLAPAAVVLAGLQWARTAATVRSGIMSAPRLNPRQIGI